MSANRCPNCDYDEVELEDSTCPACGYSLTRPNYLWIWLGIGAVVILAAIAIFWAIPDSKPSSSPAAPPSAPPSAPKVERPGSTRELVERVQPGVVSVHVPSAGKMGSGWVWDQKGYIITNAHVVAGARDVTVVLHTGKEYPGRVLGFDQAWDIAVVQVEGLSVAALPVGDSSRVRSGDEVLAFGSPLGLENTVTDGLISATREGVKTETTTLGRVFQISAPIAPGSSGGPLVDRATGLVIGVDTAGVAAEKAASIGFAVPVNEAVAAAGRIVKGR